MIIFSLFTLVSLQGAAAQASLDSLLNADRSFAAAGSKSDIFSALSVMFADDVIMPIPGGRFAHGPAAVVAFLKTNPDNNNAKVTWAPVRGGISSDGKHGFTYGYMSLLRLEQTVVPMKYLAYWIKGPKGWRVAGYKRALRPTGAVSVGLLAPVLPQFVTTKPNSDAVVAGFRESLAATERAFSLESQTIGLGPAFEKFGRPDAMNMGGQGSAPFVTGAAAIATLVSGGNPPGPSPVNWAPDEAVLVASSGDLGITFGVIHNNVRAPAPAANDFSFFTVWWRPSTSAPWRYIAE